MAGRRQSPNNQKKEPRIREVSLWVESINRKVIWTPAVRNKIGDRRRSRKRLGPGLLQCRGGVPSGAARPARQSCRLVWTRKANVLGAGPNFIAASSARSSTRRADSNAQSPSPRAFPRRTNGTSAPSSLREQPAKGRLLPRNLSTHGRLLRTFSRSNLPRKPFSLRRNTRLSLRKGAGLCAQLKIFWRAASEMATTAGFLIFLSTDIA